MRQRGSTANDYCRYLWGEYSAKVPLTGEYFCTDIVIARRLSRYYLHFLNTRDTFCLRSHVPAVRFRGEHE